MYMDIHQLKRQGFKKAQIARKLGVSRTTIDDYLKRSPEEMAVWEASTQTRAKKLDPYHDDILSWLKEHADMSAAQIFDWLQEKYGNTGVAESTVRNYVRELRQHYHLPKVLKVRHYEAIPDPPMGKQMQVDFGETRQQAIRGDEVKLYFISFVLSNSRYKVVMWLSRPFTTKDVLWAHEKAFEVLGGMPEEIVYDQDHLILVNENAGDLIYTAAFQSYKAERGFHVYMCKGADPESKGRIENVIGFVKKSFAKHRVFDNIDKWNEECQEWLDRTGNGKVHNTTKKRPDIVFQIEKKHLRPIHKKTSIFNQDNSSITVTVRKDNTIPHKGNRYSVPIGTYKHGETNKVRLLRIDNKMLRIIDANGEAIAEHTIGHGKGQLIQDTSHRRDRSKGIAEYIQTVADYFGDTVQATAYLERIRSLYPRYIRDHLQMIADVAKKAEDKQLNQALNMCIHEKLYAGHDFRDVWTYLYSEDGEKKPVDMLDKGPSVDRGRDYEQYQPTIRDMDEYIGILERGVHT